LGKNWTFGPVLGLGWARTWQNRSALGPNPEPESQRAHCVSTSCATTASGSASHSHVCTHFEVCTQQSRLHQENPMFTFCTCFYFFLLFCKKVEKVIPSTFLQKSRKSNPLYFFAKK
jgi:hypothetical protein